MSNQQRTKQIEHPFCKLGFWAKARFCFWLSMKIIFRNKDEKAINELLDIHQGSPLNITSLSNPLTHNFGINDDHVFSFACQVGAFKKFTPDYSQFLKDREARRAAGEIHTIGAVLVEIDEQGLSVHWKPGQVPEKAFPIHQTPAECLRGSKQDFSVGTPSFNKAGDARSDPAQKRNDQANSNIGQEGTFPQRGDIHE
jgi:hypothetical protein